MCHTASVYIYCTDRCKQFTREDGLVVGDETTEFCRQLWNERLCADKYVRDFWIEQNNIKGVQNRSTFARDSGDRKTLSAAVVAIRESYDVNSVLRVQCFDKDLMFTRRNIHVDASPTPFSPLLTASQKCQAMPTQRLSDYSGTAIFSKK